jgi:hypothetical protein
MKEELIAPCGMNCGLCLNYLRAENKCPGCYTGRKVNGKEIKCKRRSCQKREGNFCFTCAEFPCESIRTLDERYRDRYGMSEIENLELIRDYGMQAFLENEEVKWVSNEGTLCVHDKKRYKS